MVYYQVVRTCVLAYMQLRPWMVCFLNLKIQASTVAIFWFYVEPCRKHEDGFSYNGAHFLFVTNIPIQNQRFGFASSKAMISQDIDSVDLSSLFHTMKLPSQRTAKTEKSEWICLCLAQRFVRQRLTIFSAGFPTYSHVSIEHALMTGVMTGLQTQTETHKHRN